MYIFTLTAGRTGTAWLAEFLGQNLKVPSIHEPLEIEDMGVHMPETGLIRSFNTYGNDQRVQSFWHKKFSLIIENEAYIETNHVLGKCGLIENLMNFQERDGVFVICLTRDLVTQCASYIIRNDFRNSTIYWQWYLDPEYPRNLVDPTPFSRFDHYGTAIWYCFEMAVRQEYYRQKFGSAVKFIEVNLDDLVTGRTANDLLSSIGCPGTPILPSPTNQAKKVDDYGDLIDKLTEVFAKIAFDPIAIAQTKIKQESN